MKKAVAVTTLIVALLAVVDRFNPVRDGLNGTYYSNISWSGPAVASVRDPQLTNARLLEAWHGAPPEQFSAAWSGSLLAMHDGPYALATISDDGSSVYVDGQVVVDNRGSRTWPRGATGVVTLTRGVHAIHVRYAREGGPFHLDLLWARAGEPLERVPAWALTPRRVGFAAFAVSAGLRRALAAAEWLWVGSLVAWALTGAWALARTLRAWLQRERAWPAMRFVLAGSLVLNATGLWWGLPGGSWMPDELIPTLVLGAASKWFAHGWFDRYPPLQYYLLTAAFSPMMLLARFGEIDLSAAIPYAVLQAIARSVSVAAGLGTILAAYACGARTFGQRAGIFAAAAFALVTPFVYYAKTANVDVPYLFWFAVSLVFYLRALDRLALRDIVGFAVCGMLAICTKDQAYGLYLLMPLAIVHRLWEAHRAGGRSHPFASALFDRRLWWAAAAAAVLFAALHNLPFNLRGFRDHLALITGPASETYRDFAPTLTGRLALLRLSVDLVRVAWGWPMFLVSIAGVIIALLSPAHRRATVWLALPVIAYYAGFVNVVLYNYDRFMLPACLVLALFAGLACDRWLSAGERGRSLRAAALGAAFACTALYAAMVDIVMLRDSRYMVEQWLAAHVSPAESIAWVFPEQYYPRIERFNRAEVQSAAALRSASTEYFILNEDYGRAEPPDSEIGQLIAGLRNGQLGYSVVFRFRQARPWPWLPFAPRDLVGDRTERPITSVLRHINPWYEVFKKTR